MVQVKKSSIHKKIILSSAELFTAAVLTPLAGAKSGDFEVEACPQNDVTMLVVL